MPDPRPPFETYPNHWTVRRALEAYFEENGWTAATYDEPTTRAKVLGVTIHVPNPPRHRAALMMHDLHHCATGYGTDVAGEGEVSAWEIRRGFGPIGLYVASIVTVGTLGGLAFAPLRTLRAFLASGRHPESLFHTPMSEYEALLDLTVGELRERLGVPPGGLARERRLHEDAPAGVVAPS